MTLPLGSVTNEAIGANTDIFPTSLYVPDSKIVRLTIATDTAAKCNVIITRDGATLTLQLNTGVQLIANNVYTFDLPCLTGDEYNVQVDVAGNIIQAIVEMEADD